MRVPRSTVLALALVAGLAACDESVTSPAQSPGPEATAPPASSAIASVRASGTDLEPLAASVPGINQTLEDAGATVRLAKMEWFEPGAAGLDDVPVADAQNQQVFADDRQLRLDSRWVPGDERRDGRTGVTYTVDQTFTAATGPAGLVDSEPEIDASFDTWNGVRCSDLTVEKQSDPGGIPSMIFVGGEAEGIDVGEVGFLPGALFDQILGPGASEQVLGVTFTFVFIGPDGAPTDVDGDGNNDTAFKEVWYNDAFDWTVDANGAAQDIQTVALHENGHVLELGHFGKVHATFNQGEGNDRPGELHVSPRAVMNAVNLGTQRDLLGTDTGAFCGQFGSWPQS